MIGCSLGGHFALGSKAGARAWRAAAQAWGKPKGHPLPFCFYQPETSSNEIADTVSRRLITQRPLVQIQPPQQSKVRLPLES